MPNYPKFEKKVRDEIVGQVMRESQQPGYGLILAYDKYTNTATIITSQPGSEQMGEIYKNVPCPVNMGIQSAAPKSGYPCWIQFKDGTMTQPYITNYFNPLFRDLDYTNQYRAVNDIPMYMLEM
ncbi:MAG TPA: hypothetical protein VJ742_12185 [Nitrososphaera sp.]|nr:hypothetical protein [Nitrososphaera sp.]